MPVDYNKINDFAGISVKTDHFVPHNQVYKT